MKALFVIFALFVSVNAMAASQDFYVDPMYCVGQITGNTQSIHPSYFQIFMKLESVYSKRSDGSLAPTLIVSNDYGYKGQLFNPKTAKWGEVWYMGSLQQQGYSVFRKNLSGRNDDLSLKAVSGVSSKLKLEGTYRLGSYGYNLQCSALVVAQPTRVIDRTK